MNNMRSEGWFGWITGRREKETPPSPRDKWLTVGLKANIEWPQAFDMIAISLADEVLSESDFNFVEFMASEAEPEQVQKILDSAKAAHSTYEIKVRWQWLVMSKYRIKRLWQQYRESTAAILVHVWNSLSSEAEKKNVDAFRNQSTPASERQQVIVAMHADLSNPENAAKVQLMRQVIKVFLDVLKSPEGQTLSEDYKRMVQSENKNRGPIPFLDSVESMIRVPMWGKKFYQLVAKQLQTSQFDHLSSEVKVAALRFAHDHS